MSFTSFSSARARPVSIGQVWEYHKLYHREGRIWIRKELRRDFWESIELYKGEDRNYTTDEILNVATLAPVQVGDAFTDHDGRLRKILRPFAGRIDSWVVDRDGKPPDYEIYESSILSWSRIPKASRPADLCPLCGAPGLAMIVLFDCSSSTCRNFSNRRGSGNGKGTP